MPKVNYLGITFDSDLEVEYYKYLQDLYAKGEIVDFNYHPDSIPNLIGKRSYEPDFLVLYKDHIEVIETKGYNPYSVRIDDQIHNVMLSKSPEWLGGYVIRNIYNKIQRFAPKSKEWESLAMDKKVIYRKIKLIKSIGFVDFDFKNPNTIANKRKAKINDLSAELKELKEFKKNALRYFGYSLKLITGKKLTKSQAEWQNMYFDKMVKLVQEESK